MCIRDRYATFSPMSINNLDIEVYENGEWLSLKKGDEEFDSELFNRNLEKTFVYKKGKEMEEKMMSEVAKQKDNIEEKVEEVVEEKVEEVVEQVVEEKVDEVVKTEKPKSKGIFSRVKSFFKRK